MDRNSQTGWNTCNTGRTRLGSKCCMNEPGGIQHVRAIQRQSDGEKLGANLRSYNEIPDPWAKCLHHNGSANDCRSYLEGNLIGGGIGNAQGRQAAVDTTEPRMIPKEVMWKTVQNTVYWFKLKVGQDEGMAFWQTKGRGVLSCHDTMPVESSVSVVKNEAKMVLEARSCSSYSFERFNSCE